MMRRVYEHGRSSSDGQGDRSRSEPTGRERGTRTRDAARSRAHGQRMAAIAGRDLEPMAWAVSCRGRACCANRPAAPRRSARLRASSCPARAGRRCRTCARPWQVSRLLRQLPGAPPAFDATFAAADYVAPLDRAVTALKFSGRIGLASGLGGLLADAAGGDPGLRRSCWHARLPGSDPACAGPARRARLQPGAPDCGRDARALAGAASCPRRPAPLQASLPALRPALLARHRDTRPQSLLQRDARQANLDQGFVAAARRRRPAHRRGRRRHDHRRDPAGRGPGAEGGGRRRVVNLVVARTA